MKNKIFDEKITTKTGILYTEVVMDIPVGDSEVFSEMPELKEILSSLNAIIQFNLPYVLVTKEGLKGFMEMGDITAMGLIIPQERRSNPIGGLISINADCILKDHHDDAALKLDAEWELLEGIDKLSCERLLAAWSKLEQNTYSGNESRERLLTCSFEMIYDELIEHLARKLQ